MYKVIVTRRSTKKVSRLFTPKKKFLTRESANNWVNSKGKTFISLYTTKIKEV